MSRKAFSILALLALLLPACADVADDPGKPESDGKSVDGKAEAWNSTNNPSRFQIQFEYQLDTLPKTGAAERTPWPDTYWPTYMDSTNHRWQGSTTLSPLEKYDQAFNNWSPSADFMKLRPFDPNACSGTAKDFDKSYYEQLGPAAKYWSQYKGNAKSRNGMDDDNDGKTDECDDNDGVEGWFGLCHAWVPAAILEAEPRHAVTHNGVTFEVGDIKALLLTMYDRSSSLMLGGRCNEKELERDENGRLKRDECRDTNAGSFHVVVTNMLGRYKRAFAEDRTAGYQVWNQPVRSFEVLEQKEVTAAEAMAALGVQNATSYTFNANAKKLFKVRTTVRYITESDASTEPLLDHIDSYTRTDTYDYILELDANGNIIGGEWINYSRDTHPDFLWLPLAVASGSNPYLSMDKVRMLVELATRTQPPINPGDLKSYDQTTPVAIPDNDPKGIVSTLEIPDAVDISGLKVAVDIEHTYIGDLTVSVEHNGVKVDLHKKQGGGTDNLQQTFDVAGITGSARGTWKLYVVDSAAQDQGTLTKWSVLIGGAAPSPGSVKTYTWSGSNLAIPDNDATGVKATINVPDRGVAQKLDVTIKIDHSYIGDLEVKLVHGGFTQVLHGREGGSADDIEKTYSVTGFGATPIDGDWILSVADRAGADVGKLVAFSITAQVQ
ncbi:MAG: proprotein convertase P-domain-containing protein [Deltaproteobacteria bacterium]|nr:proprotein convertase P-domain-containing protein [Deltaproteobacteria bacterium]